LLPQLQGQPARTPLTRPAQAELAQAHADRIDVVHRHRAGGEQRHLTPRASVLQLDGLAPRLALAGVDLAQVQHLALHDAAVAATAALHHAPVLVVLAVLLASVAAQEHEPQSWTLAAHAARTKVSTTDPFSADSLPINTLQ
jgi:hypothetical protein